MICKECKPAKHASMEFYSPTEVELCPRHALVDRLAEALRGVRAQNAYYRAGGGRRPTEKQLGAALGAEKVLALYDSAASTSQDQS